MLFLHSQSRTSDRENGLVVQLVITHACHAWGRGFESRPDRQIKASEMRLFLCPSKISVYNFEIYTLFIVFIICCGGESMFDKRQMCLPIIEPPLLSNRCYQLPFSYALRFSFYGYWSFVLGNLYTFS